MYLRIVQKGFLFNKSSNLEADENSTQEIFLTRVPLGWEIIGRPNLWINWTSEFQWSGICIGSTQIKKITKTLLLFLTTIASNRKQIDEANQKERRMSYISIELPNKAREIIVLEVLGQEIPGELRRIPHDEGVIPGAPRHDRVRRRVIHHIVSLAEERGRRIPVQSGVRPRHRLLLPDRRLPSNSPTAAAILHSAPNHYAAGGWDRWLGFTEGVRSRIGAKTSLLKRGFAHLPLSNATGASTTSLVGIGYQKRSWILSKTSSKYWADLNASISHNLQVAVHLSSWRLR